MAEKTETPDVNQLQGAKLPDAAFPGGGHRDFRVYIDKAVHARIAAHLAEKTSVELMGVLVGRLERDADGPFVRVSESIRCDKAKSQAGDVTLTHDAWSEINREMDTRFRDLDIVGWYHSHPGFGIFLSERDGFIQQHFFCGPGQIAYVVDPLAKLAGVFIWRDGKPKLCPHYWVGDEIRLSDDPASQPPAGAAPSAADGRPARPQAPMFLTPAFLQGAIVALLCLLLGVYMGGRKTDWEQNMILRGAVRHYGLLKGLRPGMREGLAEVEERLQKIGQAVAVLAKEHVALLGDAAEEKEKRESNWREVRDALQDTRHMVVQINAAYSLNAEESAELERLIEARSLELDGLRKQAEKPAAGAAGSGPPQTPQPKEGTPQPKEAKGQNPAAKPPGDNAKPPAKAASATK